MADRTNDSSWPSIRLAPDKMSADLTFPPRYAHTIEETRQWLDAQGIVSGIIRTALDRSVAAAAGGSQLQTFTVARGQPPREASDGRLELNFRTNAGKRQAAGDARIDYHETGKIIPVLKDQLLARVHPPQDGAAGRDVCGREVAPQKSRGAPARFRLGRNVRQDEDRLLADCDGMVQVTGPTIQVLPDLTINGDVDYSVGNISFPGPVSIRGSVAPGFTIQAKGDVIISGGVEDARITTDANLIIRGGCAGEGKSKLVTQGKLQVSFIENSNVEARGDITVKSHILHSDVYTSSRLTVSAGKGVISGGTVKAVQGIEARVLGSHSVVRTIVSIVDARELTEALDKLRKQIDQMEAEMQKIRLAVGENKLTALLTAPEGITPQQHGVQAPLLAKLAEQYKKLDETARAAGTSREELVQASAAAAKGIIKIANTVFQGVILQIGQTSLEITDDLPGGTFRYDRETDQIIRS